MNNETNKKVVPKLRFAEFENAEEWKAKPLGQCLLQHPEYGINAAAVPYSNKLPNYLRITDISEDGFYLRNQKVSVEKEVTEANYLKEGDLVFARTGASVGKSYKYRVEDGELVFAGFLIRVRPNRKILNSDLLFHYLSTEQYWRWVNFTSTRSGQPGINSNEYSSMPILLPPSIEEQQKIADCLSSLDELVTAQSQKLEALKGHKKGLMQQLFPAEGETEPKLRFAEFRESGDWEEKTIGEIAKVTTGNKDTQDKVVNGKFPFFVRSQTVEQIDSYSYDGEAILTSGDGVGVGKNIHYINGKFNFHQRVYCIYDFNKDICGQFVYLFFSEHFYQRVMKMSAKNSVDSVRMAMVTEMPMFLPSIEEQQKIADCLFYLGEQISAQAEKIEVLKVHKKGLMQQLFSSPEGAN